VLGKVKLWAVMLGICGVGGGRATSFSSNAGNLEGGRWLLLKLLARLRLSLVVCLLLIWFFRVPFRVAA